MTAILTNFQDSSQVEATPPFAYFETLPSQNLFSTALGSDAPSSSPKKKRSHGRSRPAGHIPRPPNAFIIFRTEYIRASETQNSTPEVSKRLGDVWKGMSDKEKEPYVAKAEIEKMEHKRKYPNYKFKPVHPRDEYGNCIRKPRKPNKPRAKKGANRGEISEDLSSSSHWSYAADQETNEYPSDPSPRPSPPSTPSPPNISFLRRSSSVPLPIPDSTFFGSGFAQVTYSYGAQLARRLSKRPSTSMDYVSAGPSLFFPLPGGNEQYTMAEASTDWRLGHRRSLSAPGLGEFPGAQFAYHSGFSGVAPDTSLLTPIHPDYSSVFSAFSWSPESAEQQQPYPLNVTISVPSMSHSPSPSDLSSAVPSMGSASPIPVPLPHIVQPAPIAKIDDSALRLQISELEGFASALQGEDLGFDNVLGLTTPVAGGWENTQNMNAGFEVNNAARQKATAPHTLHFNELIIENY